MHWKATTLLVCIYGIIKEFRPGTPFLTPYLISSSKNFTLDEVYGQIFPFWTYSYMVFLIPVFILTDILLYKPIIVLEGLCLVITWTLLVWGEGVRQMQLMQIFFGLASAAEVAYYSYLYAVVKEKDYRKVTSYIRSAALLGKLLGYAFAQLLVSTNLGSYLLLNQISLAAVCIVFFIALALPSVPSQRARYCDKKGIQEEQSLSEQSQQQSLTQDEKGRGKLDNGVKNYFLATIKNFTVYKTNKVVLRWSLWWAFASCGIYQIYNYIQSLWLEMQLDPSKVENGLVEFLNTLAGAILAFLVQFAAVNWHKYGEVTVIISLAIIAVILAVISQTNYVLIAYIGYILITSMHHTLITAASCNIASELNSENYGLVFGWNTFTAVVLQTILTLAVVDSHGLNLDIRMQFVVYAAYFAVVSGILVAVYICSLGKKTAATEEDSEGAQNENGEVRLVT